MSQTTVPICIRTPGVTCDQSSPEIVTFSPADP